MSEEDLMPGIYDACQYPGQDPVALRSKCMDMSSNAEYRIQYNTKLGRLYFSYLPEDEELATTLPGDDDDDDDDDDDELETVKWTMITTTKWTWITKRKI